VTLRYTRPALAGAVETAPSKRILKLIPGYQNSLIIEGDLYWPLEAPAVAHPLFP
jgi:hypothetical protein